MNIRTCSEPYCANSGKPRGCYEVVMGFLCDSCEAAAERKGHEQDFCPVCGEYRRDHPDGETFCAIEDDDRERCPVCEVPKDEHGEVFPCQIDPQS